jgi:hypothetical protein
MTGVAQFSVPGIHPLLVMIEEGMDASSLPTERPMAALVHT